jgi:hypothetical protein
MKKYLLFAIVSAAIGSGVAKADAFDDKARAQAQQEAQTASDRAHQKQFALITQNNISMVRRVPRGASNVLCFDRQAAIYRNMQNGCRLGNSQWNGIAVQICEDSMWSSAARNLPPEIVECHYHLSNNLDCEMYRNTSIRPKCL